MGSALGPTLANAFQYILKRLGYKIVHLNLSLITTGGMSTISLFSLPDLNIQKPSVIFQMVDMLTCDLLTSTFSGVYTHFDSFLPSAYKFGTVYTLIDAFEFALVGLSYTLNQFV